MTPAAALLADGFGRVAQIVREVVPGLDQDDLDVQVEPGSNPIAWLVWHLTRVQDDHIAEVAGQEQVWTSGGWERQFGLDLPATDTGYGHRLAQVAKVSGIRARDLVGYHEAVHEATVEFLGTLSDADLPQVIDEGWDPPVTLGVRLVSVLDDDAQHAGQVAFLAGLLDRRRSD